MNWIAFAQLAAIFFLALACLRQSLAIRRLRREQAEELTRLLVLLRAAMGAEHPAWKRHQPPASYGYPASTFNSPPGMSR